MGSGKPVLHTKKAAVADKRGKWGMDRRVLYRNTVIADNRGKWGVDNHDLHNNADNIR